MKNIEFIDDKSIRVDGVLFTSSPVGNPVTVPRQIFKEKTWACYHGCIEEKEIFYITRFDHDRVFGKYDYMGVMPCENEEYTCDVSDLFTVTKEEITAHLTRIAKDKGFKVGVRYLTPCDKIEHTIDSDTFTYSRFGDDKLDCGGGMGFIYDDGEWATIIPEKKKLPKTQDEFIDFINTVTSKYFDDELTKESMKDFLSNYED